MSIYCHSQFSECCHSDLPISHGDGDGGDGDGGGDGGGGYISFFNFITGFESIPSILFFPNTAKVYLSVLSTDIVTGNSVDLSYSSTVRYGSLYSL